MPLLHMCFEGGPKFVIMGTGIHEPDTKDVINESVVEQKVCFPLKEECAFVKCKEDGYSVWSQ